MTIFTEKRLQPRISGHEMYERHASTMDALGRALAVVDASIAMFNELDSFPGTTKAHFYECAKPVVREWALITKAYRDAARAANPNKGESK